MQLKIHIRNTQKLIFPLNYNYQLMSAVYKLISSDIGFCEFLHNEGWKSGGAVFKLFCLSPLTGHYQIENKKIIFDSDISFEIRSPSDMFINAVKQELFSSGKIKLFNYDLEVRMIECYDRQFSAYEYLIKTVSPICVRLTQDNGKTLYLSPEDIAFDELINTNLYRKFTAAYGIEPPSTVDLMLLKPSKKVVTKIKDIWVTAYSGSFKMNADPVVAKFLYDVGLGSRNSQGFGMFEIKNEY